jgi:hypothetical protein
MPMTTAIAWSTHLNRASIMGAVEISQQTSATTSRTMKARARMETPA